MAQYGKTPADESWKAMEAGAKEVGMMADPVQFVHIHGRINTVRRRSKAQITIPAFLAAMPKLAGCPAD